MAVFHDPNLLKKNQQNGLYESTTGKQNSYSSGSFQPVYRDPELEGGKSVLVNPTRGGMATTAVSTPKNNYKSSAQDSGSGSGSGNNVSAGLDYQSQLNDLYNKVMGYEGYTPSTYTPGVYTPSVYQKTVDTSGTEAMLEAALADIRGYGDFQYDLNADMLYQQAVDNYTMLGQQAMQDAMGQAAALTGGYGNSYAASVGNQAYQQYLTQANNLIPQFQQQALNVWQSGYDRLLNDYNAVSQQLANLLALEDRNFNIWSANESNAANAFGMNESNRYNSWLSNEQNNYNAWESGYNQLMDQYNLGVDYIGQRQALNKSSGNGGGSSSSSKTQSANTGSKAQSTTEKTVGANLPGIAGSVAGTTLANPLDNNYFKQLAELLKK